MTNRERGLWAAVIALMVMLGFLLLRDRIPPPSGDAPAPTASSAPAPGTASSSTAPASASAQPATATGDPPPLGPLISHVTHERSQSTTTVHDGADHAFTYGTEAEALAAFHAAKVPGTTYESGPPRVKLVVETKAAATADLSVTGIELVSLLQPGGAGTDWILSIRRAGTADPATTITFSSIRKDHGQRLGLMLIAAEGFSSRLTLAQPEASDLLAAEFTLQ